MNSQKLIGSPSQDTRQIELSRDITFDEDSAFRKSKKDREDEEHETIKVTENPKPVRNEEES